MLDGPATSTDRSATIIVYCARGPGARSLFVAQTLTSMGCEHVEVLGGGLVDWAEPGLRVAGETEPAIA